MAIAPCAVAPGADVPFNPAPMAIACVPVVAWAIEPIATLSPEEAAAA
jgi:hypothetical protein